jgi:hypothetical protein
MLLRLLPALVVGLAVTACGGPDRVDVVKKYCPLAAKPYKSKAELEAFRVASTKLFETQDTYEKTDRNRRIVAASLNTNEIARVALLKAKNPKLFAPGDQGMAAAMAELKAACAPVKATPKP